VKLEFINPELLMSESVTDEEFDANSQVIDNSLLKDHQLPEDVSEGKKINISKKNDNLNKDSKK
jgi:hypothetical protein